MTLNEDILNRFVADVRGRTALFSTVLYCGAIY